jgi:hypothetical protein
MLQVLRSWVLFPMRSLDFSIHLMDRSVGIATGYDLDDHGGGSSGPGKVKNVHISISSRPSLGSTQPPIQWVPVALSRG